MQAWTDFLTIQETELGAETYNQWLKPIKLSRFDACNLYLEAYDPFQALWFEEHILPKLNRHLASGHNRRVKVHLQVKRQLSAEGSPLVAKDKAAKKPQLPFRITFDELDPNCQLHSFVTADSNLFAYRLLCKVAGYDPEHNTWHPPFDETVAFNPIYIHGPAGSGKTHLLKAVALALKQHKLKVLYVRSETFTEHVITAIRAGEMQTFRGAYRTSDVLILDDVQVFSRKGATQEELFHTFNTLHEAGKQIILSANCAPHELDAIEPRLVSRFEWGIVAPIDHLPQDKLIALLQTRAKALHFPLSPTLATFLLENFKSHTHTLCRALETLVMRFHLEGVAVPPEEIPLDQVRGYLKELLEHEKVALLTPDKIVKAVAEFYGLRTDDLLGKAQNRECSLARQVAMFLTRERLQMPYKQIGYLFARDHSTVMSGIRQVQEHLNDQGGALNSAVSSLRRQLG